MTLWHVPIQPLESRYTKQWLRWFESKFKEYNIDYKTILGDPLVSTIMKGTFLDVNGSNYYRFSQLQKIAVLFYEGKIKDGDIFFFADIEFPGHVEAVRHMAQLQGIGVKIYGFMHAASCTTEDFVSPLAPWQKYFELGWIKVCDGVFVGSKYFKDKFVKERIERYAPKEDVEELTTKIYSVGNPWNTEEVRQMIKPLPEKENIVIFPHRWEYERRPNIFVDMAYMLKGKFPEWRFIVTTSKPIINSTKIWLNCLLEKAKKDGVIEVYENLSKREYYEILAKSKLMVSTSIEENWGYTVTESATFDTHVLCPNNFSYKEYLPQKYLYNEYDDLLKKLVDFLEQYKDKNPKPRISQEVMPYLSYADTSIDRMLEVML